jgi:hypothetical protein
MISCYPRSGRMPHAVLQGNIVPSDHYHAPRPQANMLPNSTSEQKYTHSQKSYFQKHQTTSPPTINRCLNKLFPLNHCR